MNLENLLVLNLVKDNEEWINMEWDEKENVGKAYCIEFIEAFIELEGAIREYQAKRDTSVFNVLLRNLSDVEIKKLKRIYEETKRYVGFKSLDINFLLDDLMDFASAYSNGETVVPKGRQL